MSITTLFESGLYGRLRQQAGSHWQDYVDHPFLQQLAAGTLPERAFRRYLTQTTCSCCTSPAPTRCWSASCAPCRKCAPPPPRSTASSPNCRCTSPTAPNGAERSADRRPAGSGGDHELHPLRAGYRPCRRRPRPAGRPAALRGRLCRNRPAAAARPRHQNGGNPYASWIRNYGDEGYLAGVRAAIELLETVGHQRGAQGRLTELAQIFTTATQLESAFWQMGLNAS